MSRSRGEAGRRVPSVVLCAVLLVLADASLRLLGLRRTVGLVHRLATGGHPARALPDSCAAEVAGRVAMVAAFYPRRALCLEQSLTLYMLLRRAGAAAALRIGVQPRPFAAHAWVEVAGVPINEHRDFVTQLVAFPSIGG